jgi:hypothetical protein
MSPASSFPFVRYVAGSSDVVAPMSSHERAAVVVGVDVVPSVRAVGVAAGSEA